MSTLAAPHVDDKTIDQLTECFQRLSLDDPQDDIRSESSFDPDVFETRRTFWARMMKTLLYRHHFGLDYDLDSGSDCDFDNGWDSDSNKSIDPADC
jgi:hypothetical protein